MAATDDAVAWRAELDEFLVTCYADPLRYVLVMWPWGEPGTALETDVGPEAWQRDVLVRLGQEVARRAFDGATPVDPILIAIASGHGSGKTALIAWILHWLMDTRPDCKARVTANTTTQLDDATWAAVRSWGATKLSAARWTINSSGMYCTGDRANWFARPVTCKRENAQAFAGLHNRRSSTVYLFDEASTIEDEIFEVASGGLTDGESFLILTGNPTRRVGKFYRAIWGSERDHFLTWVIDCEQIQWHNPARAAVNARLYQKWKDTYGEDSDFVRVRVHGLAPNADELQFIDHARVAAAQARASYAVAGEPLIVGVDVSGGGRAWTVARFRRGADARSVPPIRLTGEQTVRDDRSFVVATLARVLADRRPDTAVSAMFIDAAFGAPIVTRLRAMGFERVFEVSFGADSPDPHRENLRAHMWAELKDWLPRAMIAPHDERLMTDLEGPGYHINRRNRLVIESKESMRERGVASPDDADALALTFALPVAVAETVTTQILPPGLTANWQ